MSTPRKRFRNNITGIVAPLILGAGFVALFAGVKYFFLIWIIGFVVVLPIIATLFEDDTDDGDEDYFLHDLQRDMWEFRRNMKPFRHTRRHRREPEPPDHHAGPDHPNHHNHHDYHNHHEARENTEQSHSTQDALSTLRQRYASGDLTDEQFERKLDQLLETETPENAAEWRERTERDVETE